MQRGFEGGGSPNPAGGRCEPPSGVRGGAPEDFKINAFQRLRTPVSLSFLSQCCYTKIHAIFFIHSHPHHFQLNQVVPNHMLWYQKKANVKELPSFESCSSPAPWGLLVFWILETVPHCDPRPKEAVHSHIHMHSLPVWQQGVQLVHACLTQCIHPEMMPCHTDVALVCSRLILRDLLQLHRRYFPSDSCWTFKTGPKCSTSGEWDPYPAIQAAKAKASFTAFLHHFRSQATKRTRRRTPWMSELSSCLLKALFWESLPYP